MAITFTLYFCFKGTVSRDFRPHFYIQISSLVPFEQAKTVCRIFVFAKIFAKNMRRTVNLIALSL